MARATAPRRSGARVISISEPGYGAALIGGIEAARGRFVIMGDADDSYDFSQLDGFVAKLRQGYDLVMGNRFKGGIAPGAMPPLHRWLGNPVLSFIGRIFFKAELGDFHCGLRGFNTRAIRDLKLRSRGMEFASESCGAVWAACASRKCRPPRRNMDIQGARTFAHGEMAGGTCGFC
jgi:glycosyltransferase involved in cell wall biosynthesis